MENKKEKLKGLGFKFTLRGNLIGYKTFNEHFPPNPDWKIKKRSVLKNFVLTSRLENCAEGINFGTVKWVKENCNKKPVWKLKVYKSDFNKLCIPYTSDGKVRCGRCKLIETIGKKTVKTKTKKKRKCVKCKHRKINNRICERGLYSDRPGFKWAYQCNFYKRKWR